MAVELLPFDKADHPIEVTPGTMTKAWLRIKRQGFSGQVTFDVRNLPFGVVVADIGLNGVLIPADQTERMIFLNCEPWVAETSRPAYAIPLEGGNPTSVPAVESDVRGSQTAAALSLTIRNESPPAASSAHDEKKSERQTLPWINSLDVSRLSFAPFSRRSSSAGAPATSHKDGEI